MGMLGRWAVASAGSLAAFAASWAVAYYPVGLDNGVALGIAGAVLAVALAVLAWWAAREPGGLPAGQAGRPGYAIGTAYVDRAVIHVGDGLDDSRLLAGSWPLVNRAADGPVVAGSVPQQPAAFQPREALIETLQERVNAAGVCVVHAVTGMRGVGKTQAAAAYARDCIARRWRLVAWVDAENAATMLDGLTRAAAAVGVSAVGKDRAGTAHAFRNWLEADGSQCLLVFDNVVDPDVLRPFLPAAGGAQIVVTSTNQLVSSLGAPLAVDVFSETEAVAYLAQRTGSSDDQGAGDIAQELGYLPLALAQAAAVVTSRRLTYPDYLSRLRAFPVTDYLPRTQTDPYPDAMTSAILLAYHATCDGDADGLCAPMTSSARPAERRRPRHQPPSP